MHIERQLWGERRERSKAVAGRWRNRLGSVMELDVAEDGSLQGTYRTGVGTAQPEAKYPLRGYVAGDVVGFCVDFGAEGSVGSWSGHHLAGSDSEGADGAEGSGERLVTLWHLAKTVRAPHDEADVWEAVLAGADEFVRAR